MKLQDTNYDNSQTGCCSLININDWDKKEFTWNNKLFIKDHVTSFFHIPLNFGHVITRVNKMIEKAEAYPSDPIWLSNETSPWGSDLFMAVEKEVPKADMQTISGTFLTKVFEGPYKNMNSWIREMNEYVESNGKKVEKLYFYYSVCPKCAKKYGKNLVVIFAKIII